MRLLRLDNASEREEDFDFTLCDYHSEIPPYAILSHRWGDIDDEISYLDLGNKNLAVKKPGYQKIKSFCRQALRDGLTHAWVDTCCIDKTSSAELSEAINSMYTWYACSNICYVHLADVPDSSNRLTSPDSAFRNSQWFTRGWTLQEMIAPTDVRFYAQNWNEIGQKSDMCSVLRDITGIPENVLMNPQNNLQKICVAQKISWTSKRQTTRVEDRAYSLIGLLDISLPILYGEGLRSFARLQEEVIRKSFDHTIFAWQLSGSHSSGLLAHSPDAFTHSRDIRPMGAKEYHFRFGLDGSRSNYSVTNVGLHIQLPRRKVKSHLSLYIAFLACTYKGRQSPIFIYIRQNHNGLPNQFFRTRKSSGSMGDVIELTSKLDKASFSPQESIWVVEPEKWAIRPLISDKIALKDITSEEVPKVYHIHLYHQGTVEYVYPLADNIDFNEISIETESNKLWTASVRLRNDCIVSLIIAIVDNKLMVHLKADDGSGLATHVDPYRFTRTIWVSPCDVPSPQASLNHRSSMNEAAKDRKEDEIIDIRQETYLFQDPIRRVFLVWLRTGIRKDLLLSNDTVMGPPEIWEDSLADLLDICDYSTDSISDLHSYDTSQLYDGVSDYESRITSYEDPYNMIRFKLGRGRGVNSGVDLGLTANLNTSKSSEKNQSLGTAMAMVMQNYGYRGLSEDSCSFNNGFASGYAAARKEATQGNSNSPRGHNDSFARGFASGFVEMYPLSSEQSYIINYGTTNVPKFITEEVVAYAEGYAVGFLSVYLPFRNITSDIEALDNNPNYDPSGCFTSDTEAINDNPNYDAFEGLAIDL